ncbi:GNAT family protein [Fictibacillus sp. Mic-4]|uniref:GNAT family N-acetyltransferase n=1 Tax=Fictibacillus sp. Mic-4 TaxID=3132826 RepID=UPI003CF43570
MFFLQVDHDIYLKLVEKKEAALLFQLTDYSRDHLRRWLGWVDQTLSIQDTKEFIKIATRKYAERTDLVTLIWYRGKPAGSVSLYDIKWYNYQASIGYWLGKEYEGNGIMTRACRALLNYSFQTLGFHRIELKAAVGNEKSRSVAERLGFQAEGLLRQAEWLQGQFVDLVIYGLLREEWQG